jgi:transcriptional regulator with XRE-family HTH domain
MSSDNERNAVSSAVARFLQRERLARGLSLAAVAAKAGLSYQMVGFVEKEERNPTLDTLLRITHALDLDLAEVIKNAQKAASRRSARARPKSERTP